MKKRIAKVTTNTHLNSCYYVAIESHTINVRHEKKCVCVRERERGEREIERESAREIYIYTQLRQRMM